MADQVLYRSIVGIPAGTGVSANLDTSNIGGDRSLTVSGTAIGTYQFEGSNDGGTTFVPVSTAITNKGTLLLFGALFKLMRLNCTAFTSGAATAQISGNKVAPVG